MTDVLYESNNELGSRNHRNDLILVTTLYGLHSQWRILKFTFPPGKTVTSSQVSRRYKDAPGGSRGMKTNIKINFG